MSYRQPPVAPESTVDPSRRGPRAGKFCRACSEFYPFLLNRHTGKPMHGRDHIAAPCAHEGDEFTPGETWWEPAVEIRPAAVAPPPPAA
jgi:hypothetical protein